MVGHGQRTNAKAAHAAERHRPDWFFGRIRRSTGQHGSLHGRQSVGCTSTGIIVSVLTQPWRTRRHGNTNACGTSRSITANARLLPTGVERSVAAATSRRIDVGQPNRPGRCGQLQKFNRRVSRTPVIGVRPPKRKPCQRGAVAVIPSAWSSCASTWSRMACGDCFLRRQST
jgi:hypothetical protein